MIVNKLVKESQDGNKQAFNELIKYYEQDLYKIARSRLDIEDDIYDAVQETILAVYRSLNDITKVSSFKTWIIRILINKCNDIYRKRANFPNFSYDYYDCDKYVSTNIQDESTLEFDSLLKSLPNEERYIVLLYYVEGYKTKEIAEILNIKHNTVRSKLSRAKLKLKEILEEDI